MKLFIQIKDGKPFEHPIMEENFISAFPGVDLNNLPPQFAKFERVQRPILGPYQVFVSENPDYELDGDTWKDVWRIRDMSNEEKVAHIQTVKTNWGAMPDAQNFSAWVFDEATCSYLPPLPRPNDGKRYFWQGTTTSWVELPPYPEDGKPYRLDVASATWVEVAA